MLDIAVNMLTWNGEDTIERALRSVLPYCREVNVCDTGSTDGTVDILIKLKREFTHLAYKIHDIAKYAGNVWENSSKDTELTFQMNQLKKETKCSWILRMDDDEVFPPETIEEMISLSGKENFYSIPFIHFESETMTVLDNSAHRNFRVCRLFKNIPEIWWDGNYGREVVCYKKKRISSSKCVSLKNPFLHLGEFRKEGRRHSYKFHTPDHCGLPIPEKYLKYVEN